MASTEEFKIKTQVEIDTKNAEVKLKNFTDPKNTRKIPVEVRLKENNKALENDIKNLGKAINKSLTIGQGNIESFQKLEKSLNNMKSTLKDMEGLLGKGKLHIVDSEVLDPKIFSKSIKTLENFVKKVEKKFDDLEKAKTKWQPTSSKPLEVDVDVEKAQYKLEKFGNKVDLLRYKFNNLDLNIVGADNIEKVENRLDSLYQKAKKNAFSGKAIMSPDVDKEMKNLREMLNLLRKVQTQFNNFQNVRVDLGDKVDVSSLDKVENAFREVFNRISSMDDLNLDFNADALLSTLKNVNRELNQSKDRFSSIKKIASDFKEEIASYTIGEALGEATVDLARDVGQAYLELDRSMRDIKKVADPGDINTVEKLNNIRKEAISVAKDVGMSSSDVQQSIAAALQAGIGGMKESIEVAKQSMILANVGDMTQDAASKAINTVVKSFRLQPLKEFQIEVGNTKQKTTELKNAMDLMNYAGNNFAIGTDGIAEAMRRGGAVLASYNVSLQDSVGLITATNEALQDPARVGNGLKTIAINLAGMKASAKDGSIDMNKTAMALKQIAGVDVFEDKKAGKLKNMVQVLDEVQDKWGQLTDAQQKALSESIAGKQQATVFQALMQNYKAFDKIRNEFASGKHFQSADKENERYVNSLDGKLNKLKETWVDTFTTIVHSDFIYGALDGLIAISEAINGIVKSLSDMNGLLPVATMIFGGVKSSISRNNPVNKQTEELKNQYSQLREILGSRLPEPPTDNIERSADKAEKKVSRLKKSYETFKESYSNGDSFKDSFKGAADTFRELGDSVDRTGDKSEKLKSKFDSFKTTLKGLGKDFLIGSAVSLAFTAIGIAVDKVQKKMNELKNTKKDLYSDIDGAKEENRNLSETKKWLESNRDRYNELITKKKEYAESGKEMTSSQKAEMEELKELQSQIAEMAPELVVGYNSDGSPILAMADDMDKLINKTQKAIDKNNELINSKKRQIGKTASEEIRFGEYGGTSLMRELRNQAQAYQLAMSKQTNQFYEKQSSALGSFGAFNGKKYSEELRKREDEVQKHYDKLLETTQSYYEKEREVQEGNFVKMSSKKSFKDLSDDYKTEFTQMFDMVNWGKFNNKDQRTWISGFDNLAKNFEKNKGSIEAYRKEWEKLNEEYSMTGDYDKYSKGLDSVAEGLAKIMNVDQSKVGSIKKGLMQVVEPLDPMSQKLNKFLNNYNKTIADVERGDSVAVKLADQFNAISNAMDIFADKESFKSNGALTFEAVVDISQLENLPQKIKTFADKAKKNGVTKLESEMIITQVEIAQSGGVTQNKDALTQALTSGKAKADIQINPDFTLTKERLDSIIEWNKNNPNNKITADDLFDMNGIAQASKSITDKVFKDFSKDKKLKIAIEAVGLDTEKKATNLKSVLESIPSNKRVEFIENFGEAFNKTENLKEAIDSIPPWKRIEYKVGLEDNAKLQSLRDTYDALKSKNVNIKLDAQGYDKLIMIDSLAKQFNNKVYNIPVDIIMKSDSVQDIVNKLRELGNSDYTIKTKFGIDVSKVEEADKKVNELKENIESVSNKEGKIKINGEEVNAKIDDVKAWAELSKEVSEGNYKMSMNLEVEDAIKDADRLEKRLSKFNNKEYKAGFTVRTAQAYNKIKALLTKVKEFKDQSKGSITVSTMVRTEQAAKNISGLIVRVKQLLSYLARISAKTVIIHTAQARKNLTGLLKKIKQFTAKKNYHASFIAHTAKAYGKINTLIARCKAYGGKTYHASFIAHTAKAYQKIGALLSRARSYSGRTFHASMTVTKNVVDGQKSVPAAANEAVPLTREAPANDGIATIDEPMAIDQPAARASSYGASRSFNGSIGGIQDAFLLMHEMIDRMINRVVGKTQSLAEAVKKGTTVVLTPIASGVRDILDALKFDVNRLQELDNTISRISHSIDVLDKRLSNSVGGERIAFIERQNTELKKRIKLNEELLKQKKREKDIYKQELKKKGLKFTKDDNIVNYEETMLNLKREMEKLDAESEKLSQASDKRSDKQKKADEKRVKAIDARKKQIESIIKLMDQFNKITYGDIFDIESSIVDDSNKVEENQLELNKIKHEQWVVALESEFKNLSNEVDKVNNALELTETRMKHAWGKDKLDLIKQQTELLKQNQQALFDQIGFMQSVQHSTQSKLMEYGFKFNSKGDIENFTETMNHLKNTSKEFDDIKAMVDGYFDLYLDKIPQVENELNSLNNQIKDLYKEQLQEVKDLEDKVMDMYRKEFEERKKLIDEELDKRLKALKKEQDAYKQSRDEQNYKNEFNEQVDKIKEIEKQVEYAKKDTSLTGQKKLKDLLKQLEEEKKKLDEITQNRIDQEVDNAFKNEEDRLQESAENMKEELDKQLTDEELLKKAQEAIKNGLFVGINGEVKDLQTALLQYIDKWEEGLSATGAMIKSEWITKLVTANDLIKDYADKLESIGVGSLNTNHAYDKESIKGTISITGATSRSINFNEPLVVVQGDVTDNNIKQIERVVKEAIDKNTKEILRKI